ncbi:MAG: hypothetical protein UHP27_05690 [Muribaculaceae bacterium]|nr:hypothetical protein [Muribaculaceae bacterium]
MKKSNIILWAAVAAMSMAGAACSDEKGFPEGATNPQLPIMGADGLQVTASVPQAIDLTALNNAEDNSVVLGTAATVNFPEAYALEFVGEMGNDADFTKSAPFAITCTKSESNPNAYTLTATADDLEGAYVEAIGKSAKPKDVYLRAQAYAKNGDSKVIIGGPETYYLNATTNITPLDLGIVIEDGYGLLGTINGWSVAEAVPFHHSDADVYEDPIFTLTVTITAQQAADGYWWKVVPNSTIAAGNWVEAANGAFGVKENGSDALSGNLVPRTDTEDCGAGCIKQAGVYKLVIDMENQTYEWQPQFDLLYMPGDANGWNHNNAQMLASAVGKGDYKGFAKLKGSFKFSSQADWNGTNYGAGETTGLLSTAGDAANLAAPTEDLVFVNVKTADLTYTITPITSVGLIGDFNGWGGQQALTSTDGLVWTGQLTVSDGQGWKFRFNDNWDINLGGDMDCLTVGGENIIVPAGSYTVTLDLTNVPYTVTLK